MEKNILVRENSFSKDPQEKNDRSLRNNKWQGGRESHTRTGKRTNRREELDKVRDGDMWLLGTKEK